MVDRWMISPFLRVKIEAQHLEGVEQFPERFHQFGSLAASRFHVY